MEDFLTSTFGGTLAGAFFAFMIYRISEKFFDKVIIPPLKNFTTYLSKKIASRGIDMMDGITIDGKTISVRPDKTLKKIEGTKSTKSKKTPKSTQDINKDKEEYRIGWEAYNKKNYDLAFKIWKPLAKKGLASAQFGIGFFYYYGYGVKQDNDKAIEWYHKAAKQEQVNAQFNLGIIYLQKEIYEKAMKWCRKAAEQGNSGAQNNLGLMYNRGEGTPKSKIDAYIWFSLANKNGNTDSKEAFEYLEEELTPDNLQKAQKEITDMIEENPALLRPQGDSA